MKISCYAILRIARPLRIFSSKKYFFVREGDQLSRPRTALTAGGRQTESGQKNFVFHLKIIIREDLRDAR